MEARKEEVKEVVKEEVQTLSRAARWEQEARQYSANNIATRAVSGINYVAGKAGFFAGIVTDRAQYESAAKQVGKGLQVGFQYASKAAGEISHYVAEVARQQCRRPGSSS